MWLIPEIEGEESWEWDGEHENIFSLKFQFITVLLEHLSVKTEEKVKVVSSVCRTDLLQFMPH